MGKRRCSLTFREKVILYIRADIAVVELNPALGNNLAQNSSKLLVFGGLDKQFN
jgi:hypothetical protein